MKNKTVKLVFAIVVLGVLVGGYFGVKSYVAGQEAKEEAAEQEEETTSVFETETDSVASVKFLIDDQEVTFVKDDDIWVKDDENDFPVDQDVLDNAVSYISGVSADRVLENVESLNEYGLDDPSNIITITTDDGAETVLSVGIENDSTSQYYVCKDDDESTVYVVDEYMIAPFMSSLYGYAEMQTFPEIDSTAITKVTVEQDENSYVAMKDEDSSLWYISSDESDFESADSSQMSSITSSLSSMEFSESVNYNCTDKGEYGFDDPYAIVTIDYEEEVEIEEEEDTEDTESTEDSLSEESDTDVSENDSEDETEETVTEIVEKQLVFMVGDTYDSDSRYVMIDGSKEVYTITNDLLSTVIDKDVSSMWNMSVYYLTLNNLKSLDVEMDGEENTIDVSRETLVVEDEAASDEEDSDEENSDVDASDDGEEAETETVITYELNGEVLSDLHFSEFYNKLINITGQRRLTEEYVPEDDPEIAVTFHDVDNNSVNVDFYLYDVNYYAAVVDNDKVYLVNKMTFKELRSSFEELLADESDDAGETEDDSEEE